MSSVLDEERREAFLQALQSLQEEQEAYEQREREETERQEEALRRDIEEARRLRAENEERERKRLEEERQKREASEVDYGVEDTPSHAGSSKSRSNRTTSDVSRSSRPARSSMAKANGKPVAPQTFTGQATIVINRLRAVIEQVATNLNNNPVLLMRLMAFIVSILVMFGSRAIRERIQRVLGSSWAKVKATAGMGTKVSYI